MNDDFNNNEFMVNYPVEGDPNQPGQPQYEKDIPFQQSDPELTKWQLDGTDVLLKIERSLKGEFVNEKNEVIQKGQVLMNEEGIRAILSICETMINKIAFLSNLDDKFIFMMVRCLGIDISQLIFLNHDEYKVEPKFMTVIVDKITFLIYVSLKRAFEQGERITLRTVERRNYNTVEQNQPKNGGFFGIFSRGEKR